MTQHDDHAPEDRRLMTSSRNPSAADGAALPALPRLDLLVMQAPASRTIFARTRVQKTAPFRANKLRTNLLLSRAHFIPVSLRACVLI
jgi:hypothetical protein